MSWREMNPMTEKVLFIADYLRGGRTFSELCSMYEISRKTGYKWISRFQDLGLNGLHEQARRPHSSPGATPYVVRKAVIDLRTKRQAPYGAKKIKTLLEQRHPDWEIPSVTTIYKILRREELVRPRKIRRKVSPMQQPFSPVREPNDVWSADFKGQFLTADGCWCYPLTVMDHQSRFLLGCRNLVGTRFEQTKAEFEKLFREYGLPWRIRTDNGVPFASVAPGGISQLSKWWIRLGIMPERIEPGKPQQNGCHERMHRTLKQDTARPPAETVDLQQGRFDDFCQDYNHERPHESLGQQTPASCYEPSRRPMPERLPELEYPGHFQICYVNPNGVINQGGDRVYVGGVLKGENMGLEEVADGAWDVFFGPVRLGCFDKRGSRSGRNNYFTLKCHPCP
jgi:putative transposase